jgi:hypothetical protein
VLAPACSAQPHKPGGVTTAACRHTRYLLSVHPRTIVSNERHRLAVHATADACGHRTPARRARVRLGRHRATTDARGRATLIVRLPTGRYLVRLYVHRRLVARTRVSAIPNVSH